MTQRGKAFIVGRFGSLRAIPVLLSIFSVALFACGPVELPKPDALEEYATIDAALTPTPPPAAAPTRVPALTSMLVPTIAPPTAVPAPVLRPDAQMSFLFDGNSGAPVGSDLVRIDFTVVNDSALPAVGVSLALEIEEPAELSIVHVVDGTCEGPICDLGSFDGHESVTGYVVFLTQLEPGAVVNVDADLSWLVGNQNTAHKYARAIVELEDIGELGELAWATGTSATAAGCDESVQVGPETVHTAFGVNLHSFDKSDGEALWKAPGDAWYSYPVLADGSLYVHASSHRPDIDSIRSFDALEGELQWEYVVDGIIRGSATVYDGSVFYTNYRPNVDGSPTQRYLMSLDASTGELNWQHKVDTPINTAAVTYGGNVYFGSYTRGTNYLYAVDAVSGELARSYQTAGGSYHTPLIADGNAYMIPGAGRLYSMDLSTGMRNWEYAPEGRASGKPLLVDGIVYTRIWDDEVGLYSAIHALDAATGRLLWQYQTGREFLPLAAANGSVYIATFASVVALDALTGRPKGLALFESVCGQPTAVDGVLYIKARNNGTFAVFAIQTGPGQSSGSPTGS